MELTTFRVEFNEKTQKFHHAYAHQQTKPNTNGWRTVMDRCTDDEFVIVIAFLRRRNNKKMTIDYIIKSIDELKQFYTNIRNAGFSIIKV